MLLSGPSPDLFWYIWWTTSVPNFKYCSAVTNYCIIIVFCDLWFVGRKFFERIILCNSLVWSCEITGQTGLTYQEAVEADRRAKSRLADFPEALRCPLLLLMQLTRRRKLTDARDDIFSFVKQHFFVEEEVMATISSQDRFVCGIFHVYFIYAILFVLMLLVGCPKGALYLYKYGCRPSLQS